MILASFASLVLAPCVAQTPDPLPATPSPAITAAELRHHVAFLASDELRGRRAGTPDAVRAARYLARALEAAGVAPAGDDGTYLQRVPLITVTHAGPATVEVTLSDGSTVVATNGIGANVTINGLPTATEALPLTVVRSADALPAEVDPSVALFVDAPRSRMRTWLSEAGLSEHGWGLVVSAGPSSEGQRESVHRGGRPSLPGTGADPCDTVRLRGALSDALEEGRVTHVRLVYDATVEEVDDYNVLGRLDGVGTPASPALADEVIVFSAHYDHVGTRGDPETSEVDVIMNGADDDASGTAAVVELAQAFAAEGPPARTLVFLLAAGEEVGLLGTRWYLDHPVEPLARTVCNLNFEMIGRPDELAGGKGKLWLTGFERSTLGPAFQQAGLDVIADPRPDQNFFQRSDNYAFAVRGIVAQTLSSYNLHEDYHRPSDEVDTLDFEHMETALRAAHAAARLLVRGELSPEWLPGGRPPSR